MLATTQGRAGLVRVSIAGPGRQVPVRLWAAVGEKLDAWARDPNLYCATVEEDFGASGFVAEPGPASPQALSASYQGVWRVDRFTKPGIALIAADALWSGFGPLLNLTHKVADPAARFAVNDVADGRIPGWGASYHLAAMPGRLGLYMALTGTSIDSALAYRFGWLTHRIPAAKFADIKTHLTDADPVDPLLDALDEGQGASPLDAFLPGIARCFSADSPAAILVRLETAAGADEAWARQAATAMRTADTDVLAATHRLLTVHAQPDLRSGLIMDHRVAINSAASDASAQGGETLFAPPPTGDAVFVLSPPPSIT